MLAYIIFKDVFATETFVKISSLPNKTGFEILFHNLEDAQAAIEKYQGKDVLGQPMKMCLVDEVDSDEPISAPIVNSKQQVPDKSVINAKPEKIVPIVVPTPRRTVVSGAPPAKAEPSLVRQMEIKPLNDDGRRKILISRPNKI